MNSQRNTNDFNRAPSRGERVFGIIGSALLVFIFGTVSFFLLKLLLSSGENDNTLTIFAITVILFLASIWLLYRISFGKKSKPSPMVIRVMSYVFVIAGCGLILIALLVEMPNPFYAFGIGVLGISMGIKSMYKIQSSGEQNKRRD